MLLNVISRPGNPFAGDAAPAHRQPRGPRRPSAATSAAPSRSTGRCCAGGVVERRRPRRTAGPVGPAHRRPPVGLRAQPAAVAVRAGRASSCSTATRRPTPSTYSRSSSPPWTIRARCCPRSRSRPRARRSPQMKADGIEYEARMDLLESVTYPKPLAGAAGRRLRDRTGAGTPGSPTTSWRRSRSPGTCPSGR